MDCVDDTLDTDEDKVYGMAKTVGAVSLFLLDTGIECRENACVDCAFGGHQSGDFGTGARGMPSRHVCLSRFAETFTTSFPAPPVSRSNGALWPLVLLMLE